VLKIANSWHIFDTQHTYCYETHVLSVPQFFCTPCLNSELSQCKPGPRYQITVHCRVSASTTRSQRTFTRFWRQAVHCPDYLRQSVHFYTPSHARNSRISTSCLKSDVTIVFLDPDFVKDTKISATSSVESLHGLGGESLHYFVANTFKTLCTKFHQNQPRFIEHMTKTLWLTLRHSVCIYIYKMSQV